MGKGEGSTPSDAPLNKNNNKNDNSNNNNNNNINNNSNNTRLSWNEPGERLNPLQCSPEQEQQQQQQHIAAMEWAREKERAPPIFPNPKVTDEFD